MKYDYKDSGIEWLGKIPMHWKFDRLRDNCVINDKALGNRTPNETIINYLDISNVDSKGIVDFEEIRELIFEEAPSRARRITQKFDTVISSVRTNLQAVAYLDFEKENLICSTGFFVCRPIHQSKLDNKFLYYFLLTEYSKDYFFSRSVGVSYPAIDDYKFGSINLPFPPLPEQRAIADYLDKACRRIDNIIEIKKKQLEKIEQSFGRKLDETFRDLRNRCSNYKKLKLVVKTTKGLAFKSSLFTDKGHPVVKASDIKEGKINKGETFIDSDKVSDFKQVALKKDDVVISTVGSQPRVPKSAVGQLAFVNEEFENALLNQNTVILRINEIFTLLPLFLYLQLKSSEYREHLDQYARGTANQSSLMLVDILKYKICLPEKSEQEKIISILSIYNEKTILIRENIEQQIRNLQSYRKSLIHECVTGKKQVWEGEIEKAN